MEGNQEVTLNNIKLIAAAIAGTSCGFTAMAADLVEVQEGDVISAEVLNGIIGGINDATTGFADDSELDGTWSCTT